MTALAEQQLSEFVEQHKEDYGRVIYDLEGQFGVNPVTLRQQFDFYADDFLYNISHFCILSVQSIFMSDSLIPLQHLKPRNHATQSGRLSGVFQKPATINYNLVTSTDSAEELNRIAEQVGQANAL